MCKLAHNWFGDTSSSTTYHFYHVPCLFEGLKRCRTTTPVIETTDAIAGFEYIPVDIQTEISNLIEDLKSHRDGKKPSPTSRPIPPTAAGTKSQQSKPSTIKSFGGEMLSKVEFDSF